MEHNEIRNFFNQPLGPINIVIQSRAVVTIKNNATYAHLLAQTTFNDPN
jgi:sulfur carrier protein ThiS